MKKCFFLNFLFCCLTVLIFAKDEKPEELIPSTTDQIATLRTQQSDLIRDLISPLSGQLVLRSTDMIVKGAQDIVLNRMYIPPYIPCKFNGEDKKTKGEVEQYNLAQYLTQHHEGWRAFPHFRLEVIRSSMTVRLTDSNGMTLEYRMTGPNYSITKLASHPYALTNAPGNLPSGKFDVRNTQISLNVETVSVRMSDGTIRIYAWPWQTSRGFAYSLAKEILPNGKVLRYYYENYQIKGVQSFDPKERYNYASLSIQGHPWVGNCHFTASTGLSTHYNYLYETLRAKIRQHHRKIEIENYIPYLSSVSSPTYRHETITYAKPLVLESYSGKNNVFTCHYAGFGDVPHFRIFELLLPVGPNDALTQVCNISYQPPKAGVRAGSTTVKNSDGTSMVYSYSPSLLLTNVQFFGVDGKLCKEKVISWMANHWLKSISMKNEQNQVVYSRSYDYDNFGNPNLEIFSGDLTGDGKSEEYTIKREFSQDGRHLLHREEHENGKVICYIYLTNTNLITSKLTKDHDHIILREFSEYDDCNNLIKHIADDGSSEDKSDLSNVTQRTLTYYHLRQQDPFLHMLERIEEKYLDKGVEKLLKKTHLHYDRNGYIEQEDIYDSEDKLAYSIHKTYNERGDLLSETNPFNKRAAYDYDLKGHLKNATNFSQRLTKTFAYDTTGRLREEKATGDDGIVHITHFEYDPQDRLKQKIDSFQNASFYTYDPIANAVTKTDFPNMESGPVSTQASYDSLGNALTKTDANGNTLNYQYNAYGSPKEIIYPDGSTEHFRYEKNGNLARHTDRDGLTIEYQRDTLGRILSKTYIKNEQTLAEETFTYNGFNLLSETDKENHLKVYSYNGAGRKIREEYCGRVTEFDYDPLGYLALIIKNNSLWIHYQRDLEGQILEEYKMDSSQNILYKIRYTYDEDGNRETLTRFINNQEATEIFAYDSLRRLTGHRDALTYLTKTVYDENVVNSLGQQILQISTTDPRFITTIETHDVFSRIVRKEVLGSNKTILSSAQKSYDPHGNLLFQHDLIYQNGQYQSTQTLKYTYTSDHRMETLTRAFGTSDARTTTCTYSPSGKLSSKTLPDSAVLTYDYDPLGYLSELRSTNLHHTFNRDKLGRLRIATDELQNIRIERDLDHFNNVTHELFSNGLEITKEYDDFDRITTLTLPDQKEVTYITYTYDPLYLRSVTYANYTHTYDDYDHDGNLLSEHLISNLGQITHLTDPRGQHTAITSPYFSQTCQYDPGHNLIQILDPNQHRYSYDGLSQLTSENDLTYTYDSLYNRTHKNNQTYLINFLNEITALSYDLNGNQTLLQTPTETFRLSYDPLNRLIDATSHSHRIHFTYDPLDRRLSKTLYLASPTGWKLIDSENYLYHGNIEIGAHSKNLRILGRSTIAIELNDQLYAPILDVQHNIRHLIHVPSQTPYSYEYTAFGEQLQTDLIPNPWRFASKRFDPILGILYFGKRDYDPNLGRWLSTDPAGFIDSVNLYQYVLNNPFRYADPDGRFLIAIPLAQLTLKVLAVAITTAIVSYEIEKRSNRRHSQGEFADAFNQAVGQLVNASGGISSLIGKNTDIYAPNRPLPVTENGVPLPDAEFPHTQLGTRKGSKGPYPQAREFDKDGNPVRDIDFTDHGRPDQHTNPHQHRPIPNPTGGTPERGPAEPLPNTSLE